VGQQDPGHPEFGHTAGVETTTGPLGQGIGNAVGMAMAARRERGLFDPNAAEGDSPFDHHIYALCSDGDIEEGVSSEASSIAGTQRLGNLTMIYDENKISIEDDTNIALSEDVPKRYEAYGWHVQVVDWTHGGGQYREDVPALYAAIRKAEGVTDQPSLIVLRTIIAWPAPHAQNTGKAHGSALGADEVAATKKILGFDPEQSFEIPVGVLEHTRGLVERGKTAQAAWQEDFDRWAKKPSGNQDLFDRLQTRTLPEGWADALPTFPADEKGMATRKASGAVINAVAEVVRAVGRVCGPRGVQQHHDRERRVVPAEGPLVGDVEGRPERRARAPLRDPRARHGPILNGIAVARRHPGVRWHVPHVLRLHARVRAARRADGTPGHLRVDARLHRPGRGRPDPPADRAPGRAARDPRPRRGPPGRRQRDRRVLAGRARAHRPAGRDRPDPAERAGLPARRGGVHRHLQRAPRRLRPARRRRRRARRGADRHRVRGAAGRAGARPARGEGHRARVVSMPCREWFDEQEAAYRETVIPPTVKARVSVEAGIKQGWHEIVGDHGRCVSVEHYGASADYARIYQEFGITAEAVANAAEDSIRVATG
jgi:transketolase